MIFTFLLVYYSNRLVFLVIMRILIPVLTGVVFGGSLKAPKISHATVLLPSDSRAVFTLSATNGCFDFTTDRPDMISLVPSGDNSCMTKAVVSMHAAFTDDHGKAWLLAHETTSHIELRAEIHISAVMRLELLTRARRLAVGEVEALQVQGYDRFGNTFSSLEGIPFTWSLAGDENILQPVRLKSTEYALSQDRLRLEESGQQSDLLIVVGFGPGKTHIAASYEKISSHPVSMTVVENFRIQPALVGFPVCSSVALSLLARSGLVNLPSETYTFSLPSAVAASVTVDAAGRVKSVTTTPTQTSVTVTDVRTDDNQEQARVCVGEPHALEIEVDTKYPIIGSTVGVSVFATSKNCPHVTHMLLPTEAALEITTSGDVSNYHLNMETSSSMKIIVGEKIGSKLEISSSLLGIDNGGGCKWNSSVVVAPLVTLIAVTAVTAETSVVALPRQQTGVFVKISGGSGYFFTKHEFDNPACKLSVVTMQGNSYVSISGVACLGSVRVGDEFNEKNSVEIRIVETFREISLALPNIESFIGYAKPFEEFVTGSTEKGLLFNCSSLVADVSLSNGAIGIVKFSPTLDPHTCGKLTIVPLTPGVADVVVSTVAGATVVSTLTVHSPFEIKPSGSLFDAKLAVIAVNSSLEFSVIGGSLQHLRLLPGEDIITLSHPWIADVVTDRIANRFKIVCKTIGESSAQISHTAGNAVSFSCSEIETIGVVADGKSSPATSVFVTCGHEEPVHFDIVAITSSGAVLDAFTAVSIDTAEGAHVSLDADLKRITIDPLACDSEVSFPLHVALPGGRILKEMFSVKARNTVRANISPVLVKDVLVLPCNLEVADSGVAVANYAIQFTGGSGDFSVQGGPGVLGRVGSVALPPSVVSIGEAGVYAVQIPTTCGEVTRFTVTDNKLVTSSPAEVAVATARVERVAVRIANVDATTEPVPTIVEHQWTELDVSVEFLEGIVVTSTRHAKWFAVTAGLLNWSAEGCEIRIRNGRVFARFSIASSVVSLGAGSIAADPAKLMVRVIKRAEFVPSLPRGVAHMTIAPFASVDVLAHSVVMDDLVSDFSVTGPLTFAESRADLVTVSPSTELGSGNVTYTVSTHEGRKIYSHSQEIRVVTPSGVTVSAPSSISSGSVATISVNFVDVNHNAFFPPHQPSACQVKWSLYGSTQQQTIEYTFAQVGEVPVSVIVWCPGLAALEASTTVSVVEAPRIKAIASLVTGAEYTGLAWPGRDSSRTPERPGVEEVRLSPSELGVVTYSNIESETISSEHKEIAVATIPTVIARFDLVDAHGTRLVVPDAYDFVSAGTNRPGLMEVRVADDAIIVTGIARGCGIVFVNGKSGYLGSVEVCVAEPTVPTGTVVLSGSTAASVRVMATSDPSLIRVDKQTASAVMAKAGVASAKFGMSTVDIRLEPTVSVESMQTDSFRFVHPLPFKRSLDDASMATIEGEREGEAVVTVKARKSADRLHLRLSDTISKEIFVEPIGRLEIVEKPTIVHKQGTRQRLAVRPVTANGSPFSVSPLINQNWRHACVVDREDVYTVRAVGGENNVLICEIEPIVVGGVRAPQFVTVSVLTGSFSSSFQLAVENHFNIVTGPYLVPVPPKLFVPAESVTVQLTNPTDSLAECEISARNDGNVQVSSFNGTAHFTIDRISPKGQSETPILVTCGSQSVEFVVSFIEAPKFAQDRFVPVFEAESFLKSTAWWIFSWIAKIVGSIAVIAGVGFLFQKRFAKPTPAKKDIHGGRLSAPPAFRPHPHPDQDMFIAERPARRTTFSKWNRVEE